MQFENAFRRLCFFLLIMTFFHHCFSNSLFAQENLAVRSAGHFGGYPTCSTVIDNYAYLFQGASMTVLDISQGEFNKIATLMLPTEPDECFSDGNFIYSFDFNWASQESHLRIVDISNPLLPLFRASVLVRQGDFWLEGKIFARNNFVYLALADELKIFDVSNPDAPVEANSISSFANDVFVKDNYAYVCSEEAFEIYDVTDINNPVEIGSCPLSPSTSVFVQGKLAFVGLSGNSIYGMQLIDITDPHLPTKLGFFETKIVEGVNTIFYFPAIITARGNFAYIGCGVGAYLFIVDISNLLTPTLAGKFNFTEGQFPDFQSLQLQYPFLYAATGATSIGFIKIDISNAANPQIVQRLEEPWDTQAMTTSRDTLYLSSNERLWIYDYADTTNPVLISSDEAWAELSQMKVRGNYLYSINRNEMSILNIADPKNIYREGVYASSYQEIFDFVIFQNLAYLLCTGADECALEIVSLVEPTQPVKTNNDHFIPGKCRDICFLPDSDFVIIAFSQDSSNQGFQIIDAKDSTSASLISSAQTIGEPIAISVIDSLLLIGSNHLTLENFYLEVFNIINPGQPINLGSLNLKTEQTDTPELFFSPDEKMTAFASINYKIPPQALKKISSKNPPNLSKLPSTKFSKNIIADVRLIKKISFTSASYYLAVVSIPSGSLHYYLFKPFQNTIEWFLSSICHSPSSTVFDNIKKPSTITFFSIDGLFSVGKKLVSGTDGVFIQRLYLPIVPVVIEMKIFPSDATVTFGDTVDFNATGINEEGDSVDVNAYWSATGGEINKETGEYFANQLGQYIIAANDPSSGLTASAFVTVVRQFVASLTIAPADTFLTFGDSLEYQAKGFDQSGQETPIEIEWSASGGEIDQRTGKYKATKVGDFVITATDISFGTTATTTVHVSPTGITKTNVALYDFSLAQNYPNPFNTATTIEFNVKEKCSVQLDIFDIRGREIIKLINKQFEPGFYRVSFAAINLATGIYLYRIRMKDFVAVKKLAFLQ